MGIVTLGNVVEASLERLREVFGAWAPVIKSHALGAGSADLGRERPHFLEHDPRGEAIGSISNERTFMEDVRDHRSIEDRLCALTERVCWRARRRGIKARTVTLKLRYADFRTLTRGRTIWPTHSEHEVFPVVMGLYRRARTRKTAVRLLGVKLSNLGFYDDQLELFEAREDLHRAVDDIRERFGFEAVQSAAALSSS